MKIFTIVLFFIFIGSSSVGCKSSKSLSSAKIHPAKLTEKDRKYWRWNAFDRTNTFDY